MSTFLVRFRVIEVQGPEVALYDFVQDFLSNPNVLRQVIVVLKECKSRLDLFEALLTAVLLAETLIFIPLVGGEGGASMYTEPLKEPQVIVDG